MKTYFRILAYGKEYSLHILFAFISLGLYNLFNAVSLTLVIPFLELLFNKDSAKPVFVAFDWADFQTIKPAAFYHLSVWIEEIGRVQMLYYFCAFIATAIFLKNVFRYLSIWLIIPMEQGVIQNMRNHLFDKLTELPLAYYSRNRKGKLINIVSNDVQIVQEAVIGTVQNLISDPITMLTFLVSMIFISWKMTLFTLIVLPITGGIIAIIAKQLKKQATEIQIRMDWLLAIVDEFITGIRIVKAFSAEQQEQNKYHHANQEYTDLSVRFRRKTDLASPLTEIMSIIVVIIIILYGGLLILKDQSELKASEFIGFIALFSQFLLPIKTFSGAISRIQKGTASFSRIEEVLKEQNTVPVAQNPVTLQTFQHGIQLQDLWFQYPENEKWTIKNLNLEIKKGEMVALVGQSGGGKSTLADLICRFYDPTKGKILIDGINLTEMEMKSYRKQTGIVTQEGILFNDTVRNNIAYGENQYSDEEIIKAAKIANAHDFIMQLPNGYLTNIGERGTKLSGGQKQRIAIARALLKNPALLILDEATSALDSESEKMVQDALNHLMQNRTSIVIAHRLSTITAANKIVVIQEGEIVEQGTHQELLQKQGFYARLYEVQFGKS